LARKFKNARQLAQKYFPSEAKANCEPEVKCRPKAKPSCKKATRTTKDGKELRLADPDTRIIIGDCRDVLKTLPARSVPLVFGDSPFNWQVKYDGWHDGMPRAEYLQFTYDWLDGCIRILAENGSLWVNIPDDTAAEVVMHLKSRGLVLINWCVWHFRFGQHRDTNFIVSKVHALYFARSKERRIWNPSEILVSSDRASKYRDKRTRNTKEPGKRVPLDVWSPEGEGDGWQLPSDVWCREADGNGWGRVQGNSKERRETHQNQLPELYLERVIRACSNPGDLVLDPFLGSGTTSTVARALGRRSIGIEISRKYAESAFERIKAGAVRV